MTEFQDLCIAFVRVAKGDVVVDGIHGVTEPSGTSEAMLTQPRTSSGNSAEVHGAKRPFHSVDNEEHEMAMTEKQSKNIDHKNMTTRGKKNFIVKFKQLKKIVMPLTRKKMP